ncbi:HAD family hydrolase [Ammoniphilus sp. CFH 90114]|uniref:HAD family hydrolase n=1 Tax=Ammoniphilus sp. CFH 90114 TaxID=2493665 RepID=UPI0013E97DBB|nr:HAD family hydrolase [Ammoniphilus sp. CFH 90114]
MYKAVFLDLDNTIFSFDEMYKKTSHEALNQVIGIQELGLAFPSFYETFRSIADELYFEYEKGKRTMDSYRDERWIRTFKHFKIPIEQDKMKELNEYIVSNYLDHVEPFTGAREFLQRLQERYRVGLITNGPVEMQLAKLGKMNMMSYFEKDLVIISEEIGVSKPDPRIFQQALARAGMTAEEAVHMGDSMKHDIVGANGIGMASALIHTEKTDLANQVPTYHFRDFFDAAEVFFNKVENV